MPSQRWIFRAFEPIAVASRRLLSPWSASKAPALFAAFSRSRRRSSQGGRLARRADRRRPWRRGDHPRLPMGPRGGHLRLPVGPLQRTPWPVLAHWPGLPCPPSQQQQHAGEARASGRCCEGTSAPLYDQGRGVRQKVVIDPTKVVLAGQYGFTLNQIVRAQVDVHLPRHLDPFFVANPAREHAARAVGRSTRPISHPPARSRALPALPWPTRAHAPVSIKDALVLHSAWGFGARRMRARTGARGPTSGGPLRLLDAPLQLSRLTLPHPPSPVTAETT